MNLFFNELSIHPISDNKYTARNKMKPFIQGVILSKSKGFGNIISDLYPHEIELAPDYSLKSWFIDKDVPLDLKNYLFGIITPPYIDEDDETIFSQYIDCQYQFEDSENNFPKTPCIGLAAAYLYESLTISLSSASFWEKVKLSLLIETEKESNTYNVFNIFGRESFEDSDLLEFIENLGEVELLEAEILPSEKDIRLADHHGKKELSEFCKRIKESPFVVAMRSTNWGGKRFIRNIESSGIIEIVLVNSERQYALHVQTTGRNYRETKAIAEIITERYS